MSHLTRFCIILMFVLTLSPVKAADFELTTLDLPTERLSLTWEGVQLAGSSGIKGMSADGRFILIATTAPNFIPEDTDDQPDLFLVDRALNTAVQVNVSGVDHQPVEPELSGASLSADGRIITFGSLADNVVPGDSNGKRGLYVYDWLTGVVRRVSTNGAGELSSTSVLPNPSLSADGRYVSFTSAAINLVPGDLNGRKDVFVKDMHTGSVQRVSVANNGTEGNHDSGLSLLSADGRYVLFYSLANNLVPGDLNATGDMFLYDRTKRTIEPTSLSSKGVKANGLTIRARMSDDARFIAFQTDSRNLFNGDNSWTYDIFLRNRTTATTKVFTKNAGPEVFPKQYVVGVSRDGCYVAYTADVLIPNIVGKKYTQDLLVYDCHSKTTGRIIGDDPEGTKYLTGESFLSLDGRFVAYTTTADHVVENDTNAASDVFVTDLRPDSLSELLAPANNAILRNENTHLIWYHDADAQYYGLQFTTPMSGTELPPFEADDICSMNFCILSLNTSLMENDTYTWRVSVMKPGGIYEATDGGFVFTVANDDQPLLQNADFETQGADAKTAQFWNGKNLTSDRRVCDPTEPSTIGDQSPCAFQFKGNAHENSRLTQAVKPAYLRQLTIRPDDALVLTARIKSANLTGTPQIKLRLQERLGGVQTLSLDVPVDTGGTYVDLTSTPFVPGGEVISAKVEVRYINAAAAGKFYVDNLQVMLLGEEATEPLSAPAAPTDLRQITD